MEERANIINSVGPLIKYLVQCTNTQIHSFYVEENTILLCEFFCVFFKDFMFDPGRIGILKKRGVKQLINWSSDNLSWKSLIICNNNCVLGLLVD